MALASMTCIGLRRMAVNATRRYASSVSPVKAFPIFDRNSGVLECNELYVHGVVDSCQSPSQRAAHAEAAKIQRAAEAAAKFMDAPSETPILLEGMASLRATHPHLPRGGGVPTLTAAPKRFAAP